MDGRTTLAQILQDNIKVEFNQEVNNEIIRIRLQLLKDRRTVLVEGYNENRRIYCDAYLVTDTLESLKEKLQCLM